MGAPRPQGVPPALRRPERRSWRPGPQAGRPLRPRDPRGRGDHGPRPRRPTGEPELRANVLQHRSCVPAPARPPPGAGAGDRAVLPIARAPSHQVPPPAPAEGPALPGVRRRGPARRSRRGERTVRRSRRGRGPSGEGARSDRPRHGRPACARAVGRGAARAPGDGPATLRGRRRATPLGVPGDRPAGRVAHGRKAGRASLPVGRDRGLRLRAEDLGRPPTGGASPPGGARTHRRDRATDPGRRPRPGAYPDPSGGGVALGRFAGAICPCARRDPNACAAGCQRARGAASSAPSLANSSAASTPRASRRYWRRR